jgi:hypothetical protein
MVKAGFEAIVQRLQPILARSLSEKEESSNCCCRLTHLGMIAASKPGPPQAPSLNNMRTNPASILTLLFRPLGRDASAGILLLVLLAAGALAESPDTKEHGNETPPVMLEALKIEELPLTSFGISLEIFKDTGTQKVISMRISEVRKGSDADKKGLGARMRIERINGRPVEEFDASFRQGSELSMIFGNRRPGAKVVLEVAGLPGHSEPAPVTLVEASETLDYHHYLMPSLVNPR